MRVDSCPLCNWGGPVVRNRPTTMWHLFPLGGGTILGAQDCCCWHVGHLTLAVSLWYTRLALVRASPDWWGFAQLLSWRYYHFIHEQALKWSDKELDRHLQNELSCQTDYHGPSPQWRTLGEHLPVHKLVAHSWPKAPRQQSPHRGHSKSLVIQSRH